MKARRDLVVWLTLALATLAVCWPLGLTNRILAGVDAFTYFDPYWAYRMAAFRAGHLPLWNPYLFLGVPFLANPQAAVLYPLHWPLSWLTSEAALVWSALLHVWLAAGFTYTLARRSFGLTRPAAWLTGALFGFGGFTLARIENINQLNALAWLPALLWLYDEVRTAHTWRSRTRWFVALTVVIALQLLAGHTQTTFINMIGLGLYALAQVVDELRLGRRPAATVEDGLRLGRRPAATVEDGLRLGRRPAATVEDGLWPVSDRSTMDARHPSTGAVPSSVLSRPPAQDDHPAAEEHPERSGGSVPATQSKDVVSWLFRRAGVALLPLLAVIPALALSAAQLLPTLELNGLGLRTGGLDYRQAVSFSLRPQLLGQTFLPPFGGGLAEAFASEGYAEFAGYVSIAGLALAGYALSRILRSRAARPALTGPVLLAAAGVFLALGAYNPVYYVLWRVVPGFDLFRAPARWLELYSLGVALLAGYGLDALGLPGPSGVPHLGRYIVRQAALILAGLAGIALLIIQQMPPLATLGGWAAALLVTTGLLWTARWRPRFATAGLLALALVELWLGARSLPFTQATAPLAAGLRNAPAALLAATADQPPAGRDRFLSLSDIRYDPGDLTALRAVQADRLPADAVERMVRAAKQTEVIAPNLSLRFGLPAVDGYDGGLLPLGRYVQLQSLFLPAESLVPDGRLREQLQQIPPDRLLDLSGVRFVITDKQRDLWADDVYYDLEHPAALAAGETLTLDLADDPPFSATGLGLVAEAAGPAGDGAALGELVVAAGDVASTFPLAAGGPLTAGEAVPLRLDFPAPLLPTRISITADLAGPGLLVRGLSLVDRRTGAHTSITVSPRADFRRIHSGDVKVYERIAAAGRAWLVHAAEVAADDTGALARLAEPDFDPRTVAVVSAAGEPPALPSQPPVAESAGEGVTVVDYTAERVALTANVTAPALLVLADADYPGWQATVDGVPAAILRTNLMFRGVLLAPGKHEIVLSYVPTSWQRGVLISLVTLGGWVVVLALTVNVRRTCEVRRT